MRDLNYYIDIYGFNGWKGSTNPGVYTNSAIVAMLKDELANPGVTELSMFDRAAIVEIGKGIHGVRADEPTVGQGQFSAMYVNLVGAPPPTSNPGASLETLSAEADANFKAYGTITFKHGGKNDPFTFYTDLIKPDGTAVKATEGVVNVQLLDIWYHGAINYTLQLPGAPTPPNITTVSPVITSDLIFANMLSLAIKYGIATATEVQKTFGTYAPAVVATALNPQIDIKLPPMPELQDARADDLFTAYIAYFGRPADPGGFKNWITAINGSQATFQDVINKFGESVEYKALYNDATPATKVNDIYRHLLNRDAEAPGLQHWVDMLNSGEHNLGNIAFEIARGAQNDDRLMVQEKVQIARNFTANMDSQREIDLYAAPSGALNARKYLSTATSNHDANVKIVGIAQEVINGLASGVDGVLANHGLHAGYF